MTEPIIDLPSAHYFIGEALRQANRGSETARGTNGALRRAQGGVPSVIGGFFWPAKEQNGGLENDSWAEDFALDGFEFVDALDDAEAESGERATINICAGESQDGNFAVWKKATEQSPIN